MSLPALPKNRTLPALTVEVLKQGIREGRWRVQLPGQRELAEELQVSRAIVRSALRQLERDGFIRKADRRRAHIVRRPSSGKKIRSIILSLMPVAPGSDVGMSYALNQLFQKGGFFPLDQTVPALERAKAGALLRKLTARDDAACWVLAGTSRQVQRYFERRRLPTVVLGHRHSGVSLPAIDLDNRAITRHAAGLLLARGHRRLAVVMHTRRRAGDHVSIRGFNEGVAAHRSPSSTAEVVRGEVGMERKLDQLFQRRDYPTGLLIMEPYAVVGVIAYLFQRGFRVPQDVSVISFLGHEVLRSLPLTIAHYSTASFERQTAALVLRQAARPAWTGAQKLIEADFVDGESLGFRDAD